jgi:urocanate hydratase
MILLNPSIKFLKKELFRERLVKEKELLVELGSDQTSCHNPFNGGYYPVGLTLDEANNMMVTNPQKFHQLVKER